MNALQQTDVRVPRTVLACDDHDVLGCDFYLMERAEGDVIRETEPERFATPERRHQIGAELIDRLAEIEAYWRELRNTLSNRLFDLLNELMTAVDTALNQRSPLK
jgi:aminoglycoside phosphotransferase (APT) family kinase protein